MSPDELVAHFNGTPATPHCHHNSAPCGENAPSPHDQTVVEDDAQAIAHLKISAN